MDEPINELDRQLRLIKRLRDKHMEAFSSFTAFEAIQELRSPLHFGDLAQQNAEAIGVYRGFFNISVRSLNYNFLMLISILFINDRQSLSIPKVMNIIESNPTDVNQFSELNADRPLLESLVDDYEGLTAEDKANIRNKLEAVRPTVEILKTHRDQILAHDDINRLVPDQLTYEDIHTLMTVADEILHLLTTKLNRESTTYVVIESEIKEQTNLLVETLRNLQS